MTSTMVTNGLIFLNVTMLTIIAALLKIIYSQLTANDRELFNRMNSNDTRITALEAACTVRHWGEKNGK